MVASEEALPNHSFRPPSKCWYMDWDSSKLSRRVNECVNMSASRVYSCSVIIPEDDKKVNEEHVVNSVVSPIQETCFEGEADQAPTS